MVFYYGRAGWYANRIIIKLVIPFWNFGKFRSSINIAWYCRYRVDAGTAVDANIIIYERAKEELRDGKTLEDAVKTSYGWNGAMRSIIDANVTHVLTGAILFVFGTGPIQGFATTLLIGIFTSLFTSIFIARMFIDKDIANNRKLTFTTNLTKDWFITSIMIFI
jgi:SecD/SecF fusion protein